MKVISSEHTYNYFDEHYNNCNIRYGDMKKQLAEDVINFTNPLREKITELSADNDYLKKVVKQGTEKAHISASKTIKEVRDIVGFRKF